MSIFSIFNHPCSFVVYYYLFGVFHLCKALFSGFLQFKGKFVDCQNTSKYRDIAPLKQWANNPVTLTYLCTQWDGVHYYLDCLPLMSWCSPSLLQMCSRQETVHSSPEFHHLNKTQTRQLTFNTSFCDPWTEETSTWITCRGGFKLSGMGSYPHPFCRIKA